MEDVLSSQSFHYPILVVDDDKFMRTILEASLKAGGYDVVTAENGAKALEIFRNGYFPIVMTDWVMPGMDGLELCKAIRADDSGHYIYIILLTSQGSKNDLIAGLDAGADEYLIKPPHQQELLTRIKTGRRIIELEIKLNEYAKQIESISLVDALTSVFNRKYMEERIPSEIRRAYRYGRALSVIIVAVDHLREIITVNGYMTGDHVLKLCSASLIDSVRKEIDWIARYNDETFVVVLPETDASGAMILAKRLRIRLASMVINANDQELKVTASFGVAGFSPTQEKQGLEMNMLLAKGESCLQQAIAEGGDTVKGVQLS
jgi:diguanylate cyclase (GGDEF)-like protein